MVADCGGLAQIIPGPAYSHGVLALETAGASSKCTVCANRPSVFSRMHAIGMIPSQECVVYDNENDYSL